MVQFMGNRQQEGRVIYSAGVQEMKPFTVTETTACLNYISTMYILPSHPTHCHLCQYNISVCPSTAAFLA